MGYYGNNDWRDYHLAHHGIKGMKWGVRRYQNPDGTLTDAGRKKYGVSKSGTTYKKSLNTRRLERSISTVEKERRALAERNKKSKDKLRESLNKDKERHKYYDRINKNYPSKERFKDYMLLGNFAADKIMNDVGKGMTLEEARKKNKNFAIAANVLGGLLAAGGTYIMYKSI